MADREGKPLAPTASGTGAGVGADDLAVLHHVDSKSLIQQQGKVPSRQKPTKSRRSSLDTLKSMFRRRKKDHGSNGDGSKDGDDAGAHDDEEDVPMPTLKHVDSTNLIREKLTPKKGDSFDDSDGDAAGSGPGGDRDDAAEEIAALESDALALSDGEGSPVDITKPRAVP